MKNKFLSLKEFQSIIKVGKYHYLIDKESPPKIGDFAYNAHSKEVNPVNRNSETNWASDMTYSTARDGDEIRLRDNYHRVVFSDDPRVGKPFPYEMRGFITGKNFGF